MNKTLLGIKMKEKDKNHITKKTCQTGNCGCSVTQIWLGIVVIIIIMIAAAVFGN